VNLCRSCSSDFSSLRLFDAHRVGMREGVRRCLAADEMTAKGWGRDGRGRWIDPARREVVERLSAVSGSALSASGAKSADVVVR
jgi:hypothetical protein